MKKILKQNKFLILPYLLSANIELIKEKKILNKKNLFKIIQNEKFKNLINKKYKYTSFIISESNIIIKTIATLLNNRFLFNEYKSNIVENGKLVKINIDILCDEYLRYLNMI